jgi:DNA-binding NarL/FixJ family response regulator
MKTPYQIFVVDDHPLIVSGIQFLLEAEADMQIVGTAADGTTAQRDCRRLQPHLLLLDLNIPGQSPVELIRAVHQLSPRTKVLIMSAYQNSVYVKALQEVGIDGYILKDEGPELLVTAVRTVLRDAKWFSRAILQMMISAARPSPAQSLWQTLPILEQQILLGIGRGFTNRQIAQEFHLSEQTVRNYSSLLYQKLGISARSDVVIWLYEHQIEKFAPKVILSHARLPTIDPTAR